jgi:glutathione S-transferase
MLLIGHYDSPFVRRIAVTLRTYGMAYDHEAWSTFGDADKIARHNPLRRVPTLVLDDGTVLVEVPAFLPPWTHKSVLTRQSSPEPASPG